MGVVVVVAVVFVVVVVAVASKRHPRDGNIENKIVQIKWFAGPVNLTTSDVVRVI